MYQIISDFKEYWGYTVQAAKSQLKAEVANSYLNWIWWILEPFALMLIYVVMFGFVFGMTEEYYPAFIFLGLTLWRFFSRCAQGSTTLVRSNAATVSKVYIPKYFLIIQLFMVNGFKMVICFIVLFGLMVVYRVPFTPMMLLAIPGLAVFLLITFGVCTFLLNFGVFIEDLSNATSIVLSFLVYATGTFYNIDTRIPAPFNLVLGRMYPIGYLVGFMRKVMLYNELPDMKLLLFWGVVGFVLSLQGIFLIYKNENSYIKVI